MNHKLSVTVQIDVDGRNVRVVVTGRLTEANQQALLPLVRRAGTLIPGVHVVVDLTGAHHVEAGGLDLLRWAVDHDGPRADGGRVELVLPDPLPEHPPTGTPRSRTAPGHSAGAGHLRAAGA